MNLFAYGTLMWPDIIKDVIGRPIEGTPAQLKNVSRLRVSGEVYPAIVPCDDGAVDGVLYENLSASEMAALDEFEGPEYERRNVVLDVIGGTANAETYFAADLSQLETIEWHPESLSSDRLAGFRNGYKGWC